MILVSRFLYLLLSKAYLDFKPISLTIIVKGECYHPEYVVFTWVLSLVALTSVLKLYYMVKTILAVAKVVMFCILLIVFYNYATVKWVWNAQKNSKCSLLYFDVKHIIRTFWCDYVYPRHVSPRYVIMYVIHTYIYYRDSSRQFYI